MARWNDAGYSKHGRENSLASGFSGYRPREAHGREMVSATAAQALLAAMKEHSARTSTPMYKLLADMGLGQSTWTRMTQCKPIAQSTALKIVTFLGTSLSAVLSKYQQESK